MDNKTKLTKAQLIEKINLERETFRIQLKKKDDECDRALAQIRHVSDMVIGRLVQTCGMQKGDDYVIEIAKPDEPMIVDAEPTQNGYRIRARRVPKELMNG